MKIRLQDSGLCDILEVESQGLAMVRAAADRAAKVYKEQAKREQTKKEQINKERDKRAKRHADQKGTANTQQEEWTKFIKSVQPSKYFEDEIIDEHGRLAINYFGSFRSEWPEPQALRALAEVAGTNSKLLDNSGPRSTRPVRFGFQRSGIYPSFLKEEMIRIAVVERHRRGYWI